MKNVVTTDSIDNGQNVIGVDSIADAQNVFSEHSMSDVQNIVRNISVLLAIYAGNSPVTGEFPAQRSVTRSFDVIFDLHRNKRLTKQWRGWWFETPSRPL